MAKTIVVIDADILAYRAAAANETRSIKATHKTDGHEIVSPHRTAFKAQIKGAFEPEEFDVVDVQTPEDISHALQTMKARIQKLKEDCKADEVELYLGGKNNFRDSLPLPTQYKFGRGDTLRPVQLKECREYLIKHQGAIVVDGYEADDKLAMRCTEGLKQGIKTIACTLDGDANGVSGWLYNWNKHTEPFLVKGFGEITINDKRNDFDGYGRKFFYAQWVYGDWGTDKFKPVDLVGKSFGVVAMYDLLKDCKNDKEAVEAVLRQYKAWYYPKGKSLDEKIEYIDWQGNPQTKTLIEFMDLYAWCCHMKRSEDDVFSTEKLLNNLGIEWKQS
jgi:hypothetical protein